MRFKRRVWIAFLLALALPCLAGAQDFKKWEARIAEYGQWLDAVRGHGFWLKVDSSRRPHRLYVGEGFYRADPQIKEQFIDIFSSYLAGHPEKFALIDLYDASTGDHIGEFGWGGFKLYPKYQRSLNDPPRTLTLPSKGEDGR